MVFMFINIINSDSTWYETHSNYTDALKEKSWIEWFLNKWGFSVEMSEYEHELEHLVVLRSILKDAIDTIISGEVLSEEQLSKFNFYLSATTLNYNLKTENGQYKLMLQPVLSNWNYVMCEIVASFVRAMHESEINKFRRCENPDCKCLYYDNSKNQARRWCCNTCSSLIKVRRFREKHQ